MNRIDISEIKECVDEIVKMYEGKMKRFDVELREIELELYRINILIPTLEKALIEGNHANRTAGEVWTDLKDAKRKQEALMDYLGYQKYVGGKPPHVVCLEGYHWDKQKCTIDDIIDD